MFVGDKKNVELEVGLIWNYFMATKPLLQHVMHMSVSSRRVTSALIIMMRSYCPREGMSVIVILHAHLGR